MATALEAPALTPGHADRQGAAGPPQAPDIMGAAERAAQPSLIPSTTTETTTTTSGVDKAGAAGIRAAGEDANRASAAAGDAQAQALRDQGALDMKQGRDAYGRGVNTYFEQAAALAVEDAVIGETAKRLEETAKFKPDRTALFKGDTGTLFGISAAISAMAGGWLMGQGLTGGKNPYLDAVMRMIDDNARDQVETNSLVYEELTKRLGSAEAAKREIKARMLGAVNDTIEAQSRFEKGELVQKGAAGIQAQVLAEQAKQRLEVEKAVARNSQTTVQRRTQMVANPAAAGGIDLTNPKEYEKVGKVKAVVDFATDAESLARTGDLANAVGFFDSWTGPLARTINASDGDRVAKVDALRAKWELMNRANWSSEPNGQAVQERLSAIAFPKNDSEIPLFLQNVRQAVNVVDPGGRYRQAARGMGNREGAVETGRTPIVRSK